MADLGRGQQARLTGPRAGRPSRRSEASGPGHVRTSWRQSNGLDCRPAGRIRRCFGCVLRAAAVAPAGEACTPWTRAGRAAHTALVRRVCPGGAGHETFNCGG